MYVNDFDENGTLEQILCQFNGDKSYPMILRHDLVARLPFLKGKYLEYERYKEQTIEDIFSKEQLKHAARLEAKLFESSVFINDKKGGFTRQSLPLQAQFSPINAISCKDYDGDGKKDLLVGGNFYEVKPEAGMYDASYGLLLKGDAKGGFTALPPTKTGIFVKGAVKNIITVQEKENEKIVFILNNAAPVMLQPNNKIKKAALERAAGKRVSNITKNKSSKSF